jgi:SAM-dependent methyltransferase
MDADQQFWDRIAESYAKKPLPDPTATARKLAVTRALLRPTDRLLDLGCGTGTILLDLAPSVAEAHGIDVSPAMIAIANTKAASTPNAHFRAAPAGTLDDIADAAYDCVCAYNLLHLVPDPPALLRAIHRILPPGGHLVSSTVCLGGVWFPPYGLVLPLMRWLGKAPALTFLTEAELREMIAAAGFVDITAPDVGKTAPGVFLVARKPST